MNNKIIQGSNNHRTSFNYSDSNDNNNPIVKDLTKEKELGWAGWFYQKVVPSKESVICGIGNVSATFALNSVFTKAVWPVVEGYLPFASNSVVNGLCHGVTQGMFTIVCKDGGMALVERVVTYVRGNEESNNKDSKDSELPVVNQGTWSKGFSKGAIQGGSYITSAIIKHYTQIDISTAYFNGAIEKFTDNKKEVNLYKRVTTAILTGFFKGGVKDCGKGFLKMHADKGKIVIEWISKNFTGIEISNYLEGLKNSLGDGKTMPIHDPWVNPKFSYGSHSDKGHCYFKINPLDPFDVTGICEAKEEVSNSFYEVFFGTQVTDKSKKE
ncbi:MAG: hypothetical protein COZ46_04250 [Verrucomicrobia bacterium CG_4_10_14_3_um_filter_43_23]|nr:MAG: hypothetical protein AUJ82_07595 [Verrucomicrobia bacterium CG1_02_43_26]PIP58637.1 MAG: hypothetical protein COX01_07820 [Verrucomicrobia bacterium CG22_combo_CG10-13_8_21_14_all_43_17]PIX58393.1 MAG: hypothetical protein COZ46_04250 [Verrucomicrobia bacterium CG_4_10_14_3_um_filter_43_23]PIY61231.1 MAG: hypothetical protein COY94_06470 [Verrucomicrobia bacterium CG_4_10_14_0_8_um_filter_43_34]PJA44954.1 MAG: hypothetical protein CO175_00085 [Verrucomicrobia bacterium CG_4_9_14_3_um_fi